jgi:hypothetical protein
MCKYPFEGINLDQVQEGVGERAISNPRDLRAFTSDDSPLFWGCVISTFCLGLSLGLSVAPGGAAWMPSMTDWRYVLLAGLGMGLSEMLS